MKVVVAFISNALANLVIGLLLARYLGPEDYGLFALAISTAILIQTIAFDWARVAAARFYSDRIRTEQPAVRATLDTCLGLLVLGLAAATMLAILSGVTASLSPSLAGLAVGVAVTNGLFDYSTALARARFRDDLYVRLVTAKNVLSLPLTVGGAFWFGSARLALAGVTLSMAGSLLGLGRNLRERHTGTVRADPRLAAVLFRYSLPIVLANLFYQTVPLVDRLLLAKTYSLAESGQFSFAYDVGVRIVAALGSMLDVLLFQVAVRADEIHGGDHGLRQTGRNIAPVFAILAPACVGLFLVLPSLEVLIAPPEFRGAFARYLGLLLPGLFCYGMIFFALNPLFQINKTTAPLVVVAAGASLANLLALTLLPADTGSFALAQGVAFLLATLALLLWARVMQPFWPGWRDLVGAALATTAMAAIVWQVGQSRSPALGTLILQVAAGGLTYAAFAGLLDLCGIRTTAGQYGRQRQPEG